MSEQIPAGWYPDPKDTTTEPRPERWWDGQGWTATTRPGPGAVEEAAGGEPTVIEGQVLESGPSVRYPDYPPLASDTPPKAARRPARPAVVAAAVAALAGVVVGSGVTYLAMDGRTDTASARPAAGPGGYGFPGGNGIPGFPGGDGGNGGDAFGGQGNGNGGSGQGNGGGLGGGLGNGQGNGKGNGKGSGSSATTAVDAVNGISLPIPSGWKGGTGTDGHASLIIGTYTCPDGSANCSLGGVVTGSLQGSDAKQAALADIAAAAKDSYGAIKGHQELKSEAVTVVGRSGYLVRWKVDAPQGNNGYVETVVFPGAKSGSLVSVRFGFDIAAKAPDVAVMDTIVQGIGTAAAGAQDGTNT
ncbi:DUF2510 domain-containing protein [Kitasatospora paranensis]|uniref:DUF2510 domain-containing protein n=1 Tax=Kitasatospora paranensis TaxID=258053 RepID=A0ABW2G0M8_9ACTN